MQLSKLLIANRGEIAVRICRSAQELGLATVQVFSEADADSLPVRMADESLCIGPPPAAKSYLNADAIIQAAKETGADAIHPGYGFLAENAAFADAVVAAGLIFVGPSGDTIRRMGDKASARKAAMEADVPVVPGSDGASDDLDASLEAVRQIGFPVMIKATAGGGGRGIRIARDETEFRTLAAQATAEAKSAFGDGRFYLEKVIENARHIEVQVLGDGERFIHCFERECSLQRRRQKIWEEAPSPALDPETREALCASAVKLAAAVHYQGAGTVEYLYDDASGQFYFIEMNTRIQVEHPVTECITGIDLIAEMIRVAGGEPLSLTQDDVAVRGHAIEVRITAEDPANDFMPFPGLVEKLTVPGGVGVRFDHLLFEGYQISPFYDSLLGKLIIHAEDRPRAIARLKRAVKELDLGSMKTSKPVFTELAEAQDVLSGRVHTKWLEDWLKSNSETLRQQHDGAS